MKKWLCCIFLAVVCAGLSVRAQSAYDAESISQVVLWTEDMEQPLTLTCMTPLGNRADLAAFINLSFHYPQYCVEMYAEGKMFYEVYVNSSGKLDSLVLGRAIPGCNDKSLDEQVRAAFNKLQKIETGGRIQYFFILEIKITLVPQPVVPVTSIPALKIWPK